MTSIEYVDIEDFRRRVGDDEEIIKELFQIYTEDVSTFLSEIDESIRNNDFEGLTGAAHALKGMSANISAIAVRDTAYKLEKLVEESESSNFRTVFEELKNNINITIEFLGQYVKEGGV